ncbi:phosphate ABC transporter substrate-binding protein PstS [Roseomonas marmotae]|uniref:Phosphate-binding protein PstS n=1 Tax=Roseomonas marmotae TaxID=2768161 RepID=A0ABS3K8V3_9PROT|nr:phosphate ABC transporter substrate-binding protein PstS [Roseomonas marmotae]MBO1073899.1 phosphate ABC transporter substrate-binding protein PstS [Roseomonas marmotae]QTI78483.1 phosphate ABC transporter substrate-binding protein PstS [Roseomonas marmotae]
MSNRLLALAAGLVITISMTSSGHAQQATITGAGASFPNPLYQKWAEAAKEGTGIQLNYQSVGSGAGQSQIRNRTVDFGASDAPMTAEQLQETKLMQFPSTMGSIVAIVNIPGVESNSLRLTGELLSDIYLGKITKWNDPRLAELNPGVPLPNLAIAPVYRADGSGTTFVWVSYLSAVSPDFQKRVGVGTSVRWPTGAGARGNEGVAGTVRNVRGAIGYVEYAYAHSNNLVTTQLRNKAGQFVTPTPESFQAAAANADWSVPDFAATVVDTHGEQSWPIVTPTFILVPTDPRDATRAQNVMKFFDWAYKNGDQIAASLDYVPLPEAVENAVRAAWAERIRADGKPVWPAN